MSEIRSEPRATAEPDEGQPVRAAGNAGCALAGLGFDGLNLDGAGLTRGQVELGGAAVAIALRRAVPVDEGAGS